MCTVCAVLPISLTKVKQLRTSTLGYVIATPTELPGVRTVCAVLPISLTKVKQLRASTLGYVIATPTEFPGVRTVCAVLPISLTKVKPLRTSTLGYVITTPLPFRVALRRAGDLRFRVAGDVYRLRRIIYAVVRCQIAIYPLGKVGGKFMHWPLLLPWLVLGLWRGSQNLGGRTAKKRTFVWLFQPKSLTLCAL